MKATIELDERKLTQIMRLAPFKTRRAAIDFALTETEKMLKLRRLAAKSFYDGDYDVLYPEYDLLKLRARDK